MWRIRGTRSKITASNKAGMKKLFLSGLLVLVAAVLPGYAQDLLPGSFAGWNAGAAPTKVTPAAAEQLAGEDAAVLREDGLGGAERRTYSRGAHTLTVTVYRMRDASGAYAAYTFLRGEQMTATDLARYSAIGGDRAVAVVNNLLLDASGLKAASLADLKALISQETALSEPSPFPTLGDYLPRRGMILGSQHYMLGPVASSRLIPLGNSDWIGFADGAEAELARYRANGQEATLVLILYPTPQAASRKLQELGRWFSLNPENISDARTAIFARRKGSLLSLAAYSRSAELANSLLDQIRFETQVTWNEPRHKLTDPSISQIVVGAIIGTGSILMFALVAGIGFGGVRLVVKYFLPGKVFDRPSNVEIIQLGLSSKPIEAKDFY